VTWRGDTCHDSVCLELAKRCIPCIGIIDRKLM
jgi:hypothetical protein